MKHTKGPWYWDSYSRIFRGDINKKERIDLIATISHLGDKSLGDELQGQRRNEAQANARLISAAPELLEACKGILAEPACGGIVDATVLYSLSSQALVKVQQAIAKAETK